MKKIIFILIFSTLFTLISNCQTKADLIGTWKSDEKKSSQEIISSNETLTFNNDDTFIMECILSGDKVTIKGEYEITKNGNHILFFNIKGTYNENEKIDDYVLEVLILTKDTLKLGYKDKSDYNNSTWKRIIE